MFIISPKICYLGVDKKTGPCYLWSMTFATTIEHELKNGKEISLEIECKFDVGNDGIGAYEYWGQRCVDRGQPVMELNVPEDVTITSATIDGREIPAEKLETLGFQRFAGKVIVAYEDSLVEQAWDSLADMADDCD